jgi:hypothetical protein
MTISAISVVTYRLMAKIYRHIAFFMYGLSKKSQKSQPEMMTADIAVPARLPVLH